MIKAKNLRESEAPGKTELYEVRKSREIIVEEKQDDGSLDQVVLVYSVEDGNVGYFAKEYRPADVQKTGAKVIDITAATLNNDKKWIKWHLYDIKDTLAGEHTVVQLYDQWSCGLRYLQRNILDQMPGYSVFPNLGVITRNFDKERMKRLRDRYQVLCEEIEKNEHGMVLAKRKKRPEIAKYRAVLKAAGAILDESFQVGDGSDTYRIHIRLLCCESGQVYQTRFPV